MFGRRTGEVSEERTQYLIQDTGTYRGKREGPAEEGEGKEEGGGGGGSAGTNTDFIRQ